MNLSNLKEKLRLEIIFRLLWFISTALGATCRFKIEGWDNIRTMIENGKGGLLLLWHGATVLPIYYCRYLGLYSIVSESRDGELQNRLLKSRGLETIRGSSARHGIRALLEGVRRLKEGKILAITPDGPKGPPKKVQPGTIHLAQRSGVPILAIGVACSPCKRLRSWDSHMIPYPFSKAVLYFSDTITIAENEDESEAATKIEQLINAADARAEELLAQWKKHLV